MKWTSGRSLFGIGEVWPASGSNRINVYLRAYLYLYSSENHNVCRLFDGTFHDPVVRSFSYLGVRKSHRCLHQQRQADG